MTPESIAALMFVCFLAGVFCWPLAYRRGKLAAARDHWRMDIDPDDEEWWQL